MVDTILSIQVSHLEQLEIVCTQKRLREVIRKKSMNSCHVHQWESLDKNMGHIIWVVRMCMTLASWRTLTDSVMSLESQVAATSGRGVTLTFVSVLGAGCPRILGWRQWWWQGGYCSHYIVSSIQVSWIWKQSLKSKGDVWWMDKTSKKWVGKFH